MKTLSFVLGKLKIGLNSMKTTFLSKEKKNALASAEQFKVQECVPVCFKTITVFAPVLAQQFLCGIPEARSYDF